jgi:hypothetical protein
MKNINTSKNIIMSAASKLRFISDTQINSLTAQIEAELLILFPCLEGKEEDGVEDWACDIVNASGDDEIGAILHRIEGIEQEKINKFKIELLHTRLNDLNLEVNEIENELNRLETESI